MNDDFYLKRFFTKLRKERLLTQNELAKELGVSVSTISNIENGVSHTLQKSTLKALSNYLNKSEIQILQDIFFYDPDIIGYDIGDFSRRNYIEIFISHYIAEHEDWDFMIQGTYEQPFYYLVRSDDSRVRRLILSVALFEFKHTPTPYEVLGAIIEYASAAKQSFNRLNEVWILFEEIEPLDKELYEKMSELNLKILKTKMKLILFDLKNKKVITSEDLV